MNCREARSCLSPYLDSELGKTRTFEVSEHLRACQPCAHRFAQEQTVEGLIREKLSDTPTMDFDALVRQAMRPKVSILRPWHMGAVGIAACLALFAWFAPLTGSLSGTSASAPVEDWITARFTQAAPNGGAFVSTGDASIDLVGEVRSVLGVSLAMKMPQDVLPGHNVKLVSVSRRSIKGGAPFVEARLNCCGHPVLLAFLPRSQADKIGPLPTETGAHIVRKHLGTDLNVTTWATPDFVLVAASPHPIDGIASSFSVVAL